jgi:hypothetical protein
MRRFETAHAVSCQSLIAVKVRAKITKYSDK